MKLSSMDDDPHFDPMAVRAKVFLEGVERKYVIFADEEGRHAVLLRLDHNGNPQIDKTGEFKKEDFWGHVRIEIPPLVVEFDPVVVEFDTCTGFDMVLNNVWPFPTSQGHP